MSDMKRAIRIVCVWTISICGAALAIDNAMLLHLIRAQNAALSRSKSQMDELVKADAELKRADERLRREADGILAVNARLQAAEAELMRRADGLQAVDQKLEAANAGLQQADARLKAACEVKQ